MSSVPYPIPPPPFGKLNYYYSTERKIKLEICSDVVALAKTKMSFDQTMDEKFQYPSGPNSIAYMYASLYT